MRFLILASIMLRFAHIAHAQNAPMLDSIAIDEDSSILLCYGTFSTSSQATVHIADTTLGVLSQTDTLIRAAMPMSGKGAAGPVTVEIGGSISNTKLVTYFHVQVIDVLIWDFDDMGITNVFYKDNLHLRGDIQSHIQSANSLSIQPSLASTYEHSANGQIGTRGSGYNGPKFDSTGTPHGISIVDPLDRQITHTCFSFPLNDNSYPCNPIQYDSSFSIIQYHNTPSCPGPFTRGKIGCNVLISEISPTEFPPSIPSSTVTAAIVGDLTLSIKSLSDSRLALHINVPQSAGTRMDVFDILGHKCTTMNQYLNAGDNLIPLNNRVIVPGKYILRIQCGNEVRSLKFVISE